MIFLHGMWSCYDHLITQCSPYTSKLVYFPVPINFKQIGMQYHVIILFKFYDIIIYTIGYTTGVLCADVCISYYVVHVVNLVNQDTWKYQINWPGKSGHLDNDDNGSQDVHNTQVPYFTYFHMYICFYINLCICTVLCIFISVNE